MNVQALPRDISYFEYKAINELVHSHIEEFGRDLRAVVAYGTLVTVGDTYDIELLEVVDDWQGPPRLQYGSTASLPLRGTLSLSFLSSAQFQQATTSRDAIPEREIIDRVLEGYEIVYEAPAGYARDLLDWTRQGYETSRLPTSSADPRRPLMALKGRR